ncbi:MAG TPA: putative glycolipid-binding domain-containing protein [Jiangellaceae bacterium]|jgi:uncharacterized protein|nr:putative glycolipid-binding domain-containing protein [Jiangellaceae bacterium]
MATTTIARWRDWAGTGIEHLVLTEDADDIIAESALLGTTDAGAVYAVRYRLRCDASWHVRELGISLVGDARRFEVVGDGAGAWRTDAGVDMPELAGALDVDLAVTPFTNTLPIRRLALAVGATADVVVAYVGFPDLAVTRESQRYRRLGQRRYRFEALGGNFVRDLDVDQNGLVVTYPGLFRRDL